jgi:hypothetical protein
MSIGLMSHIPHDAIRGGVVDIVERYGEFYSTETRAAVSGVCGATLYDITT